MLAENFSKLTLVINNSNQVWENVFLLRLEKKNLTSFGQKIMPETSMKKQK